MCRDYLRIIFVSDPEPLVGLVILGVHDVDGRLGGDGVEDDFGCAGDVEEDPKAPIVVDKHRILFLSHILYLTKNMKSQIKNQQKSTYNSECFLRCKQQKIQGKHKREHWELSTEY